MTKTQFKFGLILLTIQVFLLFTTLAFHHKMDIMAEQTDTLTIIETQGR